METNQFIATVLGGYELPSCQDGSLGFIDFFLKQTQTLSDSSAYIQIHQKKTTKSIRQYEIKIPDWAKFDLVYIDYSLEVAA